MRGHVVVLIVLGALSACGEQEAPRDAESPDASGTQAVQTPEPS